MCSCSISTRSLLRGLATVFLISVVRSDADSVNSTPPRKTASGLESQKDSILVPVTSAPTEEQLPIKPNAPDCFTHFPGTPGWNDCFRKFNQDMFNFQNKMYEYKMKTHDQKESAEGQKGGASFTRFSPDYYSGSSYINSNTFSTSNSFTGGYAIHAKNMALSTSIINNVVKVVLHTGPIDQFETQTNGNEITINVVSRGQRKFAKVRVPKAVAVTDVKVERSSDSVYLTGPTSMNDGGNFQISQSDSTGSTSSFGSTSMNMNQFGQMQAGPIPAIPTPLVHLPNFNNMFQNMFQNMFGNMFGGRSMYFNNNKGDLRDANRYYSAPQAWGFN